MTSKQIKIIAIVLGVLLVLWGASEAFSRKSDKVMGG
jgi:hypothetical protein